LNWLPSLQTVPGSSTFTQVLHGGSVVLFGSVVHRSAGTGADSSATHGTIVALPPSAEPPCVLVVELHPHMNEANARTARSPARAMHRFMIQMVLESLPPRNPTRREILLVAALQNMRKKGS
jgi:hypothetical protein